MCQIFAWKPLQILQPLYWLGIHSVLWNEVNMGLQQQKDLVMFTFKKQSPNILPQLAKLSSPMYTNQVWTTITNTASWHKPLLTKMHIKQVQEIVGTCLYFSQAVDPTFICTLSSIAAQQAKSSEAIMEACHQFLDYIATPPNVTIWYIASDMILPMHSDTSYLSEYNSKSHVRGHHFSNAPNTGSIFTLFIIIKHIVALVSVEELAALFYNCKYFIPLCITLEEMGHWQTKTTIITHTITAYGLLTHTMMHKASKSKDIWFHWLKYNHAESQFNFQ